jgi:predicted permease
MNKVILGALGVSITAFGVWLTVRLINRRERWAKRTAAVLLGAMILYPLSAGPATWILHHCNLPNPAFRFLLAAYRPMGFVTESSPSSVGNAIRSYEEFFVDIGGPSRLRGR